MMLTSVRNPFVKEIRKLHQAKGRRSQSLFLLEGTHLVQEAIATHYPLTAVCYTPDWPERYPHLWRHLETYPLDRLEEVSPEVLAAMATTVNPDGVLAIAPRLVNHHERLSLDLATVTVGLMLETIQDPGNLGAMIRTAAAARCDGIWLSADSVDLDHPKVLRASAGQWFRSRLIPCADLSSQVQALQAQGVQLIATSPTAKLSYWDLELRSPTVFLLGNEGAGLSPALTAAADQTVQIPIAAGVESLNVAIATALLLYEVQRQRRESGEPKVQ